MITDRESFEIVSKRCALAVVAYDLEIILLVLMHGESPTVPVRVLRVAPTSNALASAAQ
jgi:hypothetical protein